MWINISLIRYRNFVHKLTTHRGLRSQWQFIGKIERKKLAFVDKKIHQKRSWMETLASRKVFCDAFL